MEKEINKLLGMVSAGTITKDKSFRQIMLLTGKRKSATCKLDRIENECSIWLYTKGKCDNCGHKC